MQNRVRNPTKKLWKVLECITVESCSLGLVPPQFQFASARYDPQARLLVFHMDARFNSSKAELVVSKGAGCGRV